EIAKKLGLYDKFTNGKTVEEKIRHTYETSGVEDFVSYEELKEKAVLLVDDIFTTGATIEEASKVLKKRGAKVYAATFAMRKKRNIDMQIAEIED
ncbi:MAG: phosphoribosyltransferase family protein, partial [Acidobacteriota bacterium]